MVEDVSDTLAILASEESEAIRFRRTNHHPNRGSNGH